MIAPKKLAKYYCLLSFLAAQQPLVSPIRRRGVSEQQAVQRIGDYSLAGPLMSVVLTVL